MERGRVEFDSSEPEVNTQHERHTALQSHHQLPPFIRLPTSWWLTKDIKKLICLHTLNPEPSSQSKLFPEGT
jgi:hypothetical protein